MAAAAEATKAGTTASFPSKALSSRSGIACQGRSAPACHVMQAYSAPCFPNWLVAANLPLLCANHLLLMLQDISITVSSQDLQGQPQAAAPDMQQHTIRPKRAPPSLLRQGHKPPDAAAAAKWLQGEEGELGDAVAGTAGVAGPKQLPQPAPRMAADPSQQAQGLAHWVRVGAEGATGEAAAGEQQPAAVEAGVPGPQADLVEEEDAMDEEEWI